MPVWSSFLRYGYLRTRLGKSLGVIAAVCQFGCIAHIVFEYVGGFVVCSGPSMQPTINPQNVVLTEQLPVSSRSLHIGDIVIARSPLNPKQNVCKRIIAMEGDKVIETQASIMTQTFVPRGHVWLEGDNRDNSSDSRVYGPVPYGLITSRVFFKIWPPREFGKLQ